MTESGFDSFDFNGLRGAALFYRFALSICNGERKPGNEIMDVRPCRPEFHGQRVSVKDTRGDSPQRRIDERHVTCGPTNINSGHAQPSANVWRTGFGKRQNHGARAARRFADCDQSFRRQRSSVSERHSGHEVANRFGGMEFSIPLLPLLGQSEFHVASSDDVFEWFALHFKNESSECFREKVQIRSFPSFRFFEILCFPRLCGERARGESRERIESASWRWEMRSRILRKSLLGDFDFIEAEQVEGRNDRSAYFA